MADYYVGIDLGTTNTVCAVWESGWAVPEVIELTQAMSELSLAGLGSDRFLPSAVTVYGGAAWVGRFTRQAQLLGDGDTFASTKRLMGRDWAQKSDQWLWTPELVAACVLSVVRRELLSRYRREPTRTAITVPASFGTEARRATIRAAGMAGFDLTSVRLFDEPTAALLSEVQLRQDALDWRRTSRCMVIDVGGGTLDVSLVEVSSEGTRRRFDVKGQSRFTELAGDDFDLNIAGLLLHRYQGERESLPEQGQLAELRLLCSDLLIRAEEVKRDLGALMRNSERGKWGALRKSVQIMNTLDGSPWRTEFTGDDLVVALLEYFELNKTASDRRDRFSFFRPLQECLDTASRVCGKALDASDLDHVWLAGGSCKLPQVRLAVEQWSGQAPLFVRDPMTCVAVGAAWFAGIEANGQTRGLELVDRLFDGLYLELAGGKFRELMRPNRRAEPFREIFKNVLAMPHAGRDLAVNVLLGNNPDTEPDSVIKSPAVGWRPILTERVRFEQLLPAGHPISLVVELTENREILLELHTEVNGEALIGRLEGSLIERDDPLTNHETWGLPPVNEVA